MWKKIIKYKKFKAKDLFGLKFKKFKSTKDINWENPKETFMTPFNF